MMPPTVALLHCYDLIDDFLDSIDISFEAFFKEFTGSWIFGYINALEKAGVRCVLFCISNQVDRPSRFVHLPTGATICVLPPPNVYRAYRSVRGELLKFYGGKESRSFKSVKDDNTVRQSVLVPIKDTIKSLGTYLSTPLKTLAQELRNENCQAILCQEYEYARFDTCALLGRIVGIPVFATFQGGDRTQSILEVLPRRLSFLSCNKVIVAARTEIQRLQSEYKIPPDKIVQIFNPLDVAVWQQVDRKQARDELGIASNASVAVWHGRVEIERKGLDVLLKAWKLVLDLHPNQNFYLYLLGTGSDAEKLQSLLDQMKLQNVVWLNQFISDRSLIKRYLSAANVYVFPSRQEGFPVAPIEAMACGLPIVAADAHGVSDILESEEEIAGLIVAKNDPQSLATAIHRVFNDLALCEKLSSAALRRAGNSFSLEAIGNQLRDTLLSE